jgi:tRNA uridine 5-carbamoylmethylation protein Kti12
MSRDLTVLLLKGLPGSGKTTYARELVNAKGSNWVRTNKDDIRKMINCGNDSKNRENFTKEVRDAIILTALSRKRNVVVDDTNLNPIHEEHIRDLVKDFDVNFEVKFIDTPLDICIERNKARGDDERVGVGRILEMLNEYKNND